MNLFYIFTSCPARRCSGICAPLNFVASLLWVRSSSSLRSCARLRSTLSLRSCAPLNFDASLLWLRWASSIPDRSLNPQITPLILRNFVLLWSSAGLNKGRFRMAGHKRSWLLPLLEAACPSVRVSRSSPCRAGTCFFCGSVQSVSFIKPLSVTGGFALLVALRLKLFSL